MMHLEKMLLKKVLEVADLLFGKSDPQPTIRIETTPIEFEGEFTIVIFPFTKMSKKSPEITAQQIGEALLTNFEAIKSFTVVKGFLNIAFKDSLWISILADIADHKNYGHLEPTQKKVVVEYGGPNTNKPLHLGHVRNMLLGFATANILKQAGHTVHKVNIYNDRGIAICKSMVAYLQNGNGFTPTSQNIKGDHFVGQYYIEYQHILDREVAELMSEGKTKDQAEKLAPVYIQATQLLLQWEAGDQATIKLWQMMNNWVYEGFNTTYTAIGVDFEKDYKESDYYKKGRDMVIDGLHRNLFFKKPDGSIWVDLTLEGLDEKVLLRADGTSVYITQDIGIAKERYKDFAMDTSVYTVANEQDYHFKVLKHVLQKLGEPYANGIFHLSYGMVDLPDGKMKSREGTVVDADDLIDEMLADAKSFLENSEKLNEFSAQEKERLYSTIGLGALKYFILKVDPKKRILFNPKESIDLQGNTGPFIQYTYARIQSLLRKYTSAKQPFNLHNFTILLPAEKELIIALYKYPGIIKSAAHNYSPAEVANYCYSLAKLFNQFYAAVPILKAENELDMQLRIEITALVGKVLKNGLHLLGIEAPEKM